MTKSLIEYQLLNMREVFATGIAKVLTAYQSANIGPGLAVGWDSDSTWWERDMRPEITHVDVEMYERVPDFEGQNHIAQLRWKVFFAKKWDVEDYAYDCGPRRPCKIAQEWIRKRWNNTLIKRYALGFHASAPPAVLLNGLNIGAPPPDKSITTIRGAKSKLVAFATSDWLDLGHVSALVTTAKERQTAVFLRRLWIVNPFFDLVDRHLKQCTSVVRIPSAVDLLITQTLSKDSEREERTRNLGLRGQNCLDKNKYPSPSLRLQRSHAMYEKRTSTRTGTS